MAGVGDLLDGTFIELLLLSSSGFLVLGFDELLVDLIWLLREVARRFGVYKRHARMTSADIACPKNNHQFAIFIPAWDESAVIEAMLKNAIFAYNGKNVIIFVGCYINDQKTLEAVQRAKSEMIQIVICENQGPTTKADCLNHNWRSMISFEKVRNKKFNSVILHDAEDFVHEDEISVFDHLADRFDLIQLPVIPLLNSKSVLISGHYCDEFAESHTKALAVREAIGASLPAAGVGCAISTKYLRLLASSRTNGPFDDASLTEDYELGIGISDYGLRSAFVTMPDRNGILPVATRAYFPGQLNDSVRQKARWMIGIALAGWDRLGWGNGLMENWMRVRDRAVILSSLLVATAYLALLIGFTIYIEWVALGRPLPTLPPYLVFMLKINSAFLLWRLLARFVFVTRIYGWKQGAWSVPRIVVGNAIGILAARRAVWLYLKSLRGGALTWDKTAHSFPAEL